MSLFVANEGSSHTSIFLKKNCITQIHAIGNILFRYSLTVMISKWLFLSCVFAEEKKYSIKHVFLWYEKTYHLSAVWGELNTGSVFLALWVWWLGICLSVTSFTHTVTLFPRKARVLGSGASAASPRPLRTLCDFRHRHAPRLGCRPDALASRIGLRVPKNGESCSFCQALVLPVADHAGLFVRSR